jgi:3-oxoacyl-[acyl-carrier protein] reductase
VDLGLKDRIAVVTGSTRGLGRAAAEALAQEGCSIAVLARDVDACQATADALRAAGRQAIAVPADLGDKSAIAGAFAQIRGALGPPDILVYNNSGAPDAFLQDATDRDFADAYTLLVMGLRWCADEVRHDMARVGWGRIVTLGSICAKEPHRAPMAMLLHNVARPAQVGLAKTLANELGTDGITVNTIAIGPFDHDGTARRRAHDHLRAAGGAPDTSGEQRAKLIPLGRAGRADELGALCAFLCSDKAAFITGQTVTIDGGLTRALF